MANVFYSEVVVRNKNPSGTTASPQGSSRCFTSTVPTLWVIQSTGVNLLPVTPQGDEDAERARRLGSVEMIRLSLTELSADPSAGFMSLLIPGEFPFLLLSHVSPYLFVSAPPPLNPLSPHTHTLTHCSESFQHWLTLYLGENRTQADGSVDGHQDGQKQVWMDDGVGVGWGDGVACENVSE